MDEPELARDAALIAAFVVTYALVSGRLRGTIITGPMVFLAFGVVAGPEAVGLIHVALEGEVFRALAEITLVLVLFSDASRVNLRVLRRNASAPARMLGIGLPLTIALGTVLAVLVFDGLGWWEAALLAAILAPTDAALGQAVVSNAAVPVRLRQAINVESGLNDGIAAPAVTLFLAGAAAAEGFESTGYWVEFAAKQIGFGVLVGVGVGLVAGLLIDRATHFGLMSERFRQICILAVAVLMFALATAVEGNGFVAAFTGGLVVGNVTRHLPARFFDFSEEEGQLLALLVFLLFGASFAGPLLDALTWRVALYALLSLTVVRMVPVVLAILGLGFRPQTYLFLAWFGPRGLASIVFVLLVVESEEVAAADAILLAVTWTVLLSVILHGVTAEPASRWIGRHARRMAEDEEDYPEMADVPEMRGRFGVRDGERRPSATSE